MKEVELLYRRHKQQFLPLIFALATFFVIFRVIVPQWSDIQDAQQLLTTKSKDIETKDSNVTFLNSLPQQQVDDDYDLVTLALPVQKDAVLIFNELNDTANISGTRLGSFSLKVGAIYSVSKGAAQQSSSNISGVPYLNVAVTVGGKSDSMMNFAEQLYKSLPIVDIDKIDLGVNDARYDVNFFFKPVSQLPTNTDTTALQPLSSAENSQLKTIKSWQSSQPSPSQ